MTAPIGITLSLDGAPKVEADLRRVAGGVDSVGVSAKQTAAALRGVPAQFTDIVTSLQGGQAPLTVFLQQGGQLKDMFGGAGAAAKALGGYVVGLVNPFTVAAAAGVALALAYKQGSAEADAYARSIALTGNAAGVTTSQLQGMAERVSAVVGTQSKAAEVVAQLVGTGSISSQNLEQFTATAIRLERNAGVAVKDTVKEFAELGKEPVEAAKKLNERYNYLTAAVYEQIKALQEQGKATEATALSQQTYDKAMTLVAATLEGRLGYVERAWRAVGDASKWAWDKMLNVGRPDTLKDQLDRARANLEQRLNTPLAVDNPAMRASREKGIEALRNEINLLQEQERMTRRGADAQAERAKAEKAGIEAADALLKTQDKGLSKQQQMNAALKEYRTQLEALRAVNPNSERLAPAAVARGERAIRDQFKDQAGAATGESELATIKAKITETEKYIEALRTQGLEGAKLTEGERMALKIKEDLKTSITGTARANKELALVEAEKLGLVQRAAAAEEQRQKAVKKSTDEYAKLVDSTFKAADALQDQADKQEAANAVYGKGAAAIDALALSTLKSRMAEAQASDSFSEKFISALEQQIQAQERLNAARAAGRYKEMNESLDRELAAANQQAALYQDEYRFAGLSALERAKIVALRESELALARDLEKIEQSGAKDADKEQMRIKAREIQRVSGSAAVNKAIQDDFTRTSETIERSLTDALLRGFESGKGFAKNLRDTIANMFKTLVLRPIISAVMSPVSMAVNGIVSGGMNALGLAGNAASIYGLGSRAAGFLGFGAAAPVTHTMGALTASEAASISAGSMGSGVGAAGTGASGSGFLASIPGWGWALAGIAALGLMFSKKSTPHSGAGAIYSDALGLQTGADIYNKPTFGMGIADEYNAETSKAVGGIAKGLAEALDGVAKTFGKTAGFEIATAFADDSSKDGAWGQLRISQGGKDLLNWAANPKRDGIPKEFADGEAGRAAYIAEIAQDTRKVMLGIGLPSWADTMLNSIGELSNMDQLSAVVQQIAEVQTMFVHLGDTLVGFAGMTDKAFEALLKASGGAQALAANADAFYQGFYSPEERKDIAKRQLSEKLKGLGVDISLDDPEAKAKYRKLVKEQLAKANGEEAARSALKGSIAGALTSGGVDSLRGMDVGSIVRGVLGDAKDLTQADIDKLTSGIASLDTAGMSLDGLKDSVGKLLEPIVGTGKGAADTAAALLGLSGEFAGLTASSEELAAAEKQRKQDAIDKAYRDLQNSVGLEREQLDKQRDALNEQRGLAAESLSLITGVFDLVHSSARELFGQVESAAQMQAAQGMVFIEQALAAARGTGYLPDSKQLSEAIGAARGGIDSGLYVSEAERSYDRLVLANQLKSLEGISGKQKTAQEQQIEMLDGQLKGIDKQNKYLDDLLRDTKKQIDIANGTLNATLSVTDALTNLRELMFPDAGSDKPSGSKPSSAGSPYSGVQGSGGSPAPRWQYGEGYQGTPQHFQTEYDFGRGRGSQDVTDAGQIAMLTSLRAMLQAEFGSGTAEDLARVAEKSKAMGATMGDIASALGFWREDIVKMFAGAGIPAFAVGTNYVPNDMVAKIHEGERILPAADNRALMAALQGGGGQDNNARLERMVATLSARLEAVTAELEEIRNNTGRFAEEFGNWTMGGQGPGMVTVAA